MPARRARYCRFISSWSRISLPMTFLRSLPRRRMCREQEVLAREAGFAEARHYELAGGLMGCLVLEA